MLWFEQIIFITWRDIFCKLKWKNCQSTIYHSAMVMVMRRGTNGADMHFYNLNCQYANTQHIKGRDPLLAITTQNLERINLVNKGRTNVIPKMGEFSEKFLGGGGLFRSKIFCCRFFVFWTDILGQKILLQIFCILNRYFGTKNLQNM